MTQSIKLNKIRRLIFFFLPIILLGCSRTANSPIPTSTPIISTSTPQILIPTSIPFYPSITPFIDLSLNATETITPTPPKVTITPTNLKFPSKTPTETPTRELDSGLFLLQIISPGPMSKVISPVEFIVHIAPDYTGTTRIELIGEDGAELFRKIFKTYSYIGYFTRVDEKIGFEIRGAAEIARLQISTFDIHGQMQAFNSVRLLLQGVGENEISTPTDIQDRLLLRYPNSEDEIAGGSLLVRGAFKPATALPLIIELIGEDGTVLGSRILQVDSSNGNYQEFSTNIPYQITKKVNARLVLRQSDDRIDGLSYLFSKPLILNP